MSDCIFSSYYYTYYYTCKNVLRDVNLSRAHESMVWAVVWRLLYLGSCKKVNLYYIGKPYNSAFNKKKKNEKNSPHWELIISILIGLYKKKWFRDSSIQWEGMIIVIRERCRPPTRGIIYYPRSHYAPLSISDFLKKILSYRVQ